MVFVGTFPVVEGGGLVVLACEAHWGGHVEEMRICTLIGRYI